MRAAKDKCPSERGGQFEQASDLVPVTYQQEEEKARRKGIRTLENQNGCLSCLWWHLFRQVAVLKRTFLRNRRGTPEYYSSVGRSGGLEVQKRRGCVRFVFPPT